MPSIDFVSLSMFESRACLLCVLSIIQFSWRHWMSGSQTWSSMHIFKTCLLLVQILVLHEVFSGIFRSSAALGRLWVRLLMFFACGFSDEFACFSIIVQSEVIQGFRNVHCLIFVCICLLLLLDSCLCSCWVCHSFACLSAQSAADCVGYSSRTEWYLD